MARKRGGTNATEQKHRFENLRPGNLDLEHRLMAQLTVTVFIALVALLATITLVTNAMDVRRMDSSADAVLDVIMRYNGNIPSDLPEQALSNTNNEVNGWLNLFGTSSSTSQLEETREARFFVVTTSSDGTVQSSNLDNTTLVTQQDVEDYAQEALGKGSLRGYVDDFRYLIRYYDDGNATIAFLDRGRQREALAYSLRLESALSILAALVVTTIVGSLSRRIVRPIVESHRRQRQFVTNAGHDLRTPVSIISADADVLSLEVGQNEWIDDIKKQVSVMTDLTESLVTLAKASEGVGPSAELVNLSEVVEESLKGFASRAQLEKHELKAAIDPDIHIMGEPQYLARLSSQLVDNALKYSSDGTPIEVALHKKSRQALLQVRNATNDIDPSEVRHWFDRFYQSDKARTHRGGGFGIGLSMVQAVAEAHGGKATAEATANGTSVTVTVTLPLAKEGHHDKQSK